MAELKRNYVVPLRKGFLKTPVYKRSKKAVKVLKEFIAKHMKSEDVAVQKELNEHIWKHGIKNPPSRVSVTAVKDKEGKVSVNLESVKAKEETKKPAKKETKAKKEESLEAEVEKAEAKTEEVKTEDAPKEEVKTEAKEEPAKKE
ncbi:60S ribosomal protein L31 [Candidatus Woesearchaeota archaeon]|nr:60S ribosomal protein L31 [Candidatus Woesearchaeota archaeon]